MVDPRITDTYGINYDYASAMHYEDGAGALYSGARTITAKDSNFQVLMILNLLKEVYIIKK